MAADFHPVDEAAVVAEGDRSLEARKRELIISVIAKGATANYRTG
jgi:hypothetical protein